MPTKTAESTKLRAEIAKRFTTIDRLITKADRTDFGLKLDTRDTFKASLDKTNAHGLMEILLTKIDDWISMQEINTDDYDMGLIMKASALRHKVILEPVLSKQIQQLNQAIELVEHVKDKPEGFNVYMNSMMILHETYREQNRKEKAKEVLFKAKEAYDRFIESPNKLLWNYDSVFEGTPPITKHSDDTKRYFRLHLANCLYQHYKYYDDTLEHKAKIKKYAEYIIPSLQYLEYRYINAQSYPYKMFEKMTHIVYDLLKTFRFKQFDHCLAGMMYHLVQFRRTVSDDEKKKIIALQHRIASMFTEWGAAVADFSMGVILGEEGVPIDNDTYEELRIFKVPGVEVYAHQFPIDVVRTSKEVKKVIKKVHSWDQKTEELSKESGEGKWIAGKNSATRDLNAGFLEFEFRRLNLNVKFRDKKDFNLSDFLSGKKM